MKFMITEAFLKELVKRRVFDKKLVASLASEIIEQADSTELARYLLNKDVATELLVERLQKDPVAEFRRLKEMTPQVEARPRRGRPAKSNGVGGAKPKRGRGRPPKADVAKEAGSGRKRKRMSADKADKLKNDICEFLKANPGSSRLQIFKAVKIPSAAIYNRLMGTLKETGEVVGKGEKRNAVYYLK